MGSLAVFGCPARYVQGRDATKQLGEQLQKIGVEGPLMILASNSAARLLGPTWEACLPAAGYTFTLVPFGGECTAAEIDALVARGRELGAKAVVGAGGGKIMDVIRAAADQLGARVICCPTVASSDAPCSALSVVYTPEGVVDHVRYYKQVAGLGDALATYFEARSSFDAHSNNVLGGACTITGMALAELCYKTLLADGPAACAAVEAKAVTPALERIIEANTLLSGLGFETAGLCVAHATHNGLTKAPGALAYLHGEKVAFGTVTQLVLEGRPQAELDTVYGFCCRVGLPVTLAQIGVDASDSELLMACAEKATLPEECCHSEPFKVTAVAVRDAMLAADALGRQYLSAATTVANGRS